MGVRKRPREVDTLRHQDLGFNVVFETLELYIVRLSHRVRLVAVVVLCPSYPFRRRRPSSVRPSRPSIPSSVLYPSVSSCPHPFTVGL